MQEKYKKYLPSKNFMVISGSSFLILFFVFIVFFLVSREENFNSKGKKPLPLKIGEQSLSEILQNDTDEDGVADWEEALWGTNKDQKITFEDTPDITYIENKKKELQEENSTQIEKVKMTETEKFARQFFGGYTALKASGEVNKEQIEQFSGALGSNIANPTLADQYTEADARVLDTDTLESKQQYYTRMQKLFESYVAMGIGDELEIVERQVIAGSGTYSREDITKLLTIAGAYQEFGKKVSAVEVPKGLVEYHLRIANSSNNTGVGVLGMTKVAEDPIVGLSGFSQYQKYSSELVQAVADLETSLLN